MCGLKVAWRVSEARGQGTVATGAKRDWSLRVPLPSAGMAFASRAPSPWASDPRNHTDHFLHFKKVDSYWVPVAHTCNPSYSGGRDQDDHSSKLALGK
jgi:hypothetical protein